MDKEFVISYLKMQSYRWQTGEVSPTDNGIVRHEYLDEKRDKKLFFCEEGLRRALTPDRDEGKSTENVVAWHLIKRGYRRKVFFDAYYWKNKHVIPAASVEKEKISVLKRRNLYNKYIQHKKIRKALFELFYLFIFFSCCLLFMPRDLLWRWRWYHRYRFDG